MANQVEIKITADPKDAEAGLKKVKSGFQSMKDSIVKNRKAIGVGILAMGAGIEALAQKQAGLTEATRKLAGTIEYHRTNEEPITIALLHTYVPNEGDAWGYSLDAIGLIFPKVILHLN